MDCKLGVRGALATVIAAVLCLPGAAGAQAPVVDPAFGTDGRVVTTMGATSSGSFDVLVADALGRVTTAGRVQDRTGPRLAIVRLTPSGARDTTFGDGGERLVDLGGAWPDAHAIARQSDGGVVVLARASTGRVLVRVTVAGDLDTSFGDGGIRRVPDDTGSTLVVDAADRLLLSATDRRVRRYRSDGAVDPTFGTAGTATVPGYAHDIAPDGNDLLVAVGRSGPALDVVRLREDGTPDTAFGSDGVASVPVSSSFRGTATATVAPDGGVLVGAEYSLVKLTRTGQLDPSFGTGGVKNLERRVPDLRAAEYDLAGRIVTLVVESYRVEVRRYSATGELDASFGDGGIATDHGIRPSPALAVSPAGAFVMGWSLAIPEGSSGKEHSLVTRLGATGARDQLYGGPSGRATVTGGSHSSASLVDAVMLGDRTVAVGNAWEGDVPQIGFAAYGADGELDPAFGQGGRALLSAPGGHAMEAARLGDGLVVANYVYSAPYGQRRFEAYAIHGDGSRRLTFGDAGVARALPPERAVAAVTRAVAVDAAGRVLLVGELEVSYQPEKVGVARLLPDGTLDRSYGGGDGWATVQLRDDSADALPVGIHVDEDGAATVVTRVGAYYSEVASLRLTPSGELDPEYGDGGIAIVPGTFEHVALDSAAAPGEGVIVAGGGGAGYWMLRLDDDGRLDPTFGQAGFARVGNSDDPGSGATIDALRVAENGTIVVSGGLWNRYSQRHRVYLGRYLPNGLPDPTWGPYGQAVGPVADSRTIASGVALALPRAGRYVTGGSVATEGTSFGLLGWRDPEPVPDPPVEEPDPDPPVDEPDPDPPVDEPDPDPPVDEPDPDPPVDEPDPDPPVDKPEPPVDGDDDDAKQDDTKQEDTAHREDAKAVGDSPPTGTGGSEVAVPRFSFPSAPAALAPPIAAPVPRPSLRVPRQRLATVLRRGLLVRVACPVACRVRITVAGTSRVISLPTGRSASVRVPLSVHERRRLRKAGARPDVAASAAIVGGPGTVVRAAAVLAR